MEETYQRCRDLRPREAMEMVRAARERLPDDEKLLSLERVIKERLQQQSVDERRGEYLSRAREALKEGQYSDAVHILEACEAEGIANAEVHSLLEFARNEEKESTTQNLKRSKLIRAQYLVNQGAYEEAIAFLNAALAEERGASLRLLLEQATNARQAAQRQVECGAGGGGQAGAGGQDRRMRCSFCGCCRRTCCAAGACRWRLPRWKMNRAGRCSAWRAGRMECWGPTWRRDTGSCSGWRRRRPMLRPRPRWPRRSGRREQASADRALAEAAHRIGDPGAQPRPAGAEKLVQRNRFDRGTGQSGAAKRVGGTHQPAEPKGAAGTGVILTN